MDVLKFFHINKLLDQRIVDLEARVSNLVGRNTELHEFNDYLKNKLDRLEDILYKRFGLLKDIEAPSNEPELEPIKTSESWPSAKRRFENASRTKTSELDKERQEYWRKRNEDQAKAREEALKNNEEVITNGN